MLQGKEKHAPAWCELGTQLNEHIVFTEKVSINLLHFETHVTLSFTLHVYTEVIHTEMSCFITVEKVRIWNWPGNMGTILTFLALQVLYFIGKYCNCKLSYRPNAFGYSISAMLLVYSANFGHLLFMPLSKFLRCVHLLLVLWMKCS
jgi:hypothetical protein